MQHSELPESVRYGRVSLYAAGFGAASIGIVVMGRAVDDAAFALLALTLMAAGFAASGAVRLGRLARPVVEGVLLTVLAVCTVLIFINPVFRYTVLPIQTLASPDLVLATILVWLMVMYSFNLRTDRAVLFMCVPSLSLIGLMSTFDPTNQPLAFFILYLCFSCLALIQQNALSHAAPEEHHQVRGNVKLAVGIICQALVVGAILGWVLETALDRAAGPQIIARNMQSPQEAYSDSNFMEVATGPTVLGEREIMTVKCREPLLWRSQVYDRYVRRGWMSTMPAGEPPDLIASQGRVLRNRASERFASYPSCFRMVLDPECRGRQNVKRVDQVFRATGGRIGSVYAAAEPELVAFRGPQMLHSANGRIALHLLYSKGASYAVSSMVSTATPRELRRASTSYSRQIERRYIEQFPDSCRQIEPLLDELVGQLPTTYDKVVAIRNYLEANYTYDLTAPAAPADEDAVVHFLLKSRRGYCDVFASSMAIMCRLSGIPARVAVGYATGKRDAEEEVYRVRQRDRHAWVEVYFPDYGWITFDPAPQAAGSSLTGRIQAVWNSVVTAVTTKSSSFWMLVLLACLIGYLLKVECLDRLLRVRRTATRPAVSVGRAADNYRRMCDAFGRLGYPRPASMTPREYYRDLERILRPNCANLVPSVQAVTDDFVEARYAGRQISRDRTAATASLLSDLVREVRQAAKHRLLPETGESSG